MSGLGCKVNDPRLPVRFWSKMAVAESGCWVWIGAKTKNGYAVMLVRAPGTKIGWSQRVAHRTAYTALVGGIAEGMQLDHLCRNRGCVNPEHLEVVTPRENSLRGESLWGVNGRKTACPAGHPYDKENTHLTPKGERKCRACNRLRHAARAKRRVA